MEIPLQVADAKRTVLWTQVPSRLRQRCHWGNVSPGADVCVCVGGGGGYSHYFFLEAKKTCKFVQSSTSRDKTLAYKQQVLPGESICWTPNNDIDTELLPRWFIVSEIVSAVVSLKRIVDLLLGLWASPLVYLFTTRVNAMVFASERTALSACSEIDPNQNCSAVLPLPEQCYSVYLTSLYSPHKLPCNLHSSRDMLKLHVFHVSSDFGMTAHFLLEYLTSGIICHSKSGPHLQLIFSKDTTTFTVVNHALLYEHSCGIAQYKSND